MDDLQKRSHCLRDNRYSIQMTPSLIFLKIKQNSYRKERLHTPILIAGVAKNQFCFGPQNNGLLSWTGRAYDKRPFDGLKKKGEMFGLKRRFKIFQRELLVQLALEKILKKKKIF